jgi:hypothetical protein
VSPPKRTDSPRNAAVRDKVAAREDAGPAGAAGGPQAGGKLDPNGVANYRPGENPATVCGNCNYFVPGRPTPTCQVVSGPIDPTMTCDFWHAAGGAGPSAAGALMPPAMPGGQVPVGAPSAAPPGTGQGY